MLVTIKHIYSRERLISMLLELETMAEPALTIYLKAGSSAGDLKLTRENIPASESIPPDAEKKALASRTGAVLFWGQSKKYLVLPGLPLNHKSIMHGYNTEPLKKALAKDYEVGVILIRLGAYALGLFRGRALVASKVGSGLVHARHKKGGSSQRRFERHREKQIELFFNNVCQHVREKLEPYVKTMDYAYYGGERRTLDSFLQQCSYLRVIGDRVVPILLNVREPKQASLAACVEQVYSSAVLQWRESGD